MRLFGDDTSAVRGPFFARALTLAESARGRTSPNPLVGCVIVQGGEIVAEGFHAQAGGLHAEAEALRAAGDCARGADVYVTLEPCAHFGRTPPCADALIDAGVKRVFIGMPDPTPLAGGGAARLRDAGIEVSFAEDSAPFEELNRAWLKRVRTGLPLVTVKAGLSLDAHPALKPGLRSSMTGASGAQVTRRLRATHSAVAVGASTVIADDPALTVRDALGTLDEWQPARLVLLRDTLPPADSRLFTDGAARTLVVAPKELETTSLEAVCDGIVRYASEGGIEAMFRAIAEAGFDSVLVESGPALFTSLWEAQLMDRLVTVTAGGMAGAGAPPLFTGAPDADAGSLRPTMMPVEAGIVSEVSVTVWAPKGIDTQR